MPSISRACKGKHGRCPNVVTGPEKYCPECQGTVKSRPTPRERVIRGRVYNRTQWRTARQMFLREHPTCTECAKHGRLTPATEVHHVTPIREAPELTFDPENLMALCMRCHSSITAKGGGA
jgi:5-methylcytosine-specific restriction protein A